MPKIQPFRASYYADSYALADVVVSPDNFRATDSQHPQGFYLLDFSQDHAAVKERLHQWCEAGYFEQDDAPCYYVDVQNFFYAGRAYTRRDVFASVDVLSADILPHEDTLPAVVQERYGLLETTETHFSPLFLLYSDPNLRLQTLLEQYHDAEPFLAFTQAGIKHQVFRIQPDHHPDIEAILSQQRFYVADGHHRYAAARAYASRTGKGRHTLAYFSAFESEGLRVLPYHRHILPGFKFPPWNTYLAALDIHFELTPLPDTHLSTLQTALSAPERCWVMQKQNRAWTLRPRHASQQEGLALDVLHKEVLEQLAGFDAATTRRGKCIRFSTDMAALQYALLTEGGVAFYVQPTPLNELCARAQAHQMMPPKSTYFYPKVPSGILFNRFSTAV